MEILILFEASVSCFLNLMGLSTAYKIYIWNGSKNILY